MPVEVLSPQVVSQIAAGEVVERPAHLVKELIENSLDAGATDIQVEVSRDVAHFVVRDDGCGMNEADLRASIQPFATSKIKVVEDLFRLNTFGFRGEALASIAAVACLEITTKTKNQHSGLRLTTKFGAPPTVVSSPAERGTTVVVDDLFANVPARKKFSKSATAEFGAVQTTVRALALANPTVNFRLLRAGELVGFWPGVDDLCARAQSVLDVGPFVPVAAEDGELRLRAALLPAGQVFKNSRNIWLFAQGRWIQDKTLSYAVIEAYRSTLMHKEFPAAVVQLEVNPALIDVNVHPAKSQVRFSSELDPFRVVQRALRGALERAATRVSDLAGDLSSNTFTSPGGAHESRGFAGAKDSASFQSHVKNFAPTPRDLLAMADPKDGSASLGIKTLLQSLGSDTDTDTDTGTGTGSMASGESQPALANSSAAARPASWASLMVIGQVLLTYLLCDDGTDLVVIDQHAAHERVLYDSLLEKWEKGLIEVELLLLPEVVELLNEEEAEALLREGEGLKAVGVEIQRTGPREITLYSVPTLLGVAGVTKALAAMASELVETGGGRALQDLVTHVCATMACHSAVRAGQRLTMEQMTDLLRQMDQVRLSDYCPHGRPVEVRISERELARRFGRIT